MKPKKIKLKDGERIVAVEPKVCNGPGWRNEPTWVYIMAPGGDIRRECIQPQERTSELNTLFKVGAAIVKELIASIPYEVEK